ncbi:hypothetical protein C8R45DRAFT_484419 [Mycena sanguinolenta]|nr:hypothetical protein C8R45DRAFT_484419 [Mycena sanguinolenta]
MVEPRASIYYLSSFAQFLQPKEAEDQSLHQEETRDASATKKARVVNHLSTLFSRGKAADEEIRVVAVAAGSVLRDELEVYVTTSSSSTTSVVAAQTESSDQSNKTLLQSRNSGNEKDGVWTQKTILAGEDYHAVLRLAEAQTFSFVDFVHISVRLLRAGGARIITQPDDLLEIQQDIMKFFVKSCLSEIKARFTAIKKTYGELASFKAWTPSADDSVKPTTVVITNSWMQSHLQDANIQHSAENYNFNTANAPLWWRCLVEMLLEMGLAITAKEPDVVAAISEAIHHFLSLIPKELWRMEGLRDYLKRRRLSKRLEIEEDTEEESTADALPAGDDSLPVEARAFFRATDAVCAWTTGAKYLLRSQLAKSTAPLIISLVDFPREDIKESTSEALIDRWRSLTSEPWPDKTLQDIKKKLLEFKKTMPGTAISHPVVNVVDSAVTAGADPTTSKAVEAPTIGTTKRACHCEAGLIASIYLRQKDILKDLPPEKREPPAVADAFANFSAKTRDSFTVGVAKKCCPTCKIMIDILRGHQLDLHISGAHSRYHPWVPPQWLPDDIMEELEKRLVMVVSEMLVNPSPASSPTSGSDHGGSPIAFPTGEVVRKLYSESDTRKDNGQGLRGGAK